MFVRDRMTKTRIQYHPVLLLRTQWRFQEKGFRRFPVVDNGKLVGILTKKIFKQFHLQRLHLWYL